MGQEDAEILIVGAGPTGLTLATWLALSGTNFRIVDPKPGPTQETRAVGIQARTLEMWDLMGLGEEVARRGRTVGGAVFWVRGKVAAEIPLGDMGTGLTAHPYIFILGQDQTEHMLAEKLGALGRQVEWGTSFVSLEQADDRVKVKLKGDTETDATFRYVCGCDGARSAVRSAIGLEFPGGTYSKHFFVADVIATGGLKPGKLNLALFDDRFLIFFPLADPDRYRLIGTLPTDLDPKAATIEDLRPEVERLMNTQIASVRWFSVYHVHHRVAAQFQVGNVFLLGDAGHVHSPVGGQGMNTGILDAINLAWKLREVVDHKADPKLLATYPAERIPFAKTLVKTTDRAFELIVSGSRFAQFVRLRVAPKLISLLLRFKSIRRRAFQAVSQTRIEYRASAISQGQVGKIHAGDRLPWVVGLYEQQEVGRWWLYRFGPTSQVGNEWTLRREIGVSTCPITDEMRRLGYREGYCLMRPDGYVGLAMQQWNEPLAESYMLKTVGIPGH